MSYPDRIDFEKLNDGQIIVIKMRRNGRRSIPTEHEIKAADFDLDAALDWCRENGYTVRSWHYGARAWRGKPWPIRTVRQIIEDRDRLRKNERHYFHKLHGGDALKEGTSHKVREMWSKFSILLGLDLAYDG
ncbi:MAG: hypothetical protein GY832_25300 [Chloroflexi bacterium]|nr:hypothetical protein [Chloroflexota bacterium]